MMVILHELNVGGAKWCMNLPVLSRFTLHHKIIRTVGQFTFTISVPVPTTDQNHMNLNIPSHNNAESWLVYPVCFGTSRCCCCCFCFFFYCLLLQFSLSWLHRKEGLSASWLRIKTASPTAQLSLRVVGCFQSVGVAKGIMTSSCEWQMQIGRECGGLILTFFLFFLLWGTLVVSSPHDARRSPRNSRATECTLVWERARSRAFLWVHKPVGDFFSLASVGRL
jgi:hypothetical protein